MSDLVARLREYEGDYSDRDVGDAIGEAADRIEALEAERDRWMDHATQLLDVACYWRREVIAMEEVQ